MNVSRPGQAGLQFSGNAREYRLLRSWRNFRVARVLEFSKPLRLFYLTTSPSHHITTRSRRRLT
jgi:hypothetical protein